MLTTAAAVQVLPTSETFDAAVYLAVIHAVRLAQPAHLLWGVSE